MRLRKMKNAATPAIQAQAPRQTIHQHSTNWPLIILVSVLCVPLILFLMWAITTFLFYMMDFDEPGRQAASAIFWLLVLAIVALLSYFIGGYIVDKIYDGKIGLQQAINDGLRHQQLMAQNNVTNSTQISEDARLVKLIMLVMWQAYDYYNRHGEYSTNDPKPWSRRSVAALTIKGESKPVGEAIINGKVKRFLEREDVIISNQINIDDFPDLDSVRELLESRFNVPVRFFGRVDSRASLPDQSIGFSEEIQK